jgi:anti-sigma regulatory factor (Ser/Thr protein kinase)
VQLELALPLPREQRSVPVARNLVRAAMRTLGVDADCTSDVEVALSEAYTRPGARW